MPAEPAGELLGALLAELLRDAHRYAPGIEPGRPTRTDPAPPLPRRVRAAVRERGRDTLERVAAGAGFSHRHYDPEAAAARLRRILELAPGLEATYARLADERSRRTMLDVLKLRVLGPFHAPLAITPARFRARQAQAERRLRLRHGTYEVSDPWFSPLSLYRVPVASGGEVTLHSHSVDIASVYLLGQYSHPAVHVRPGDVVIDAGGCWGDTALYFACLAGPAGKVFTFEFDPESVAILRANLALNPALAKRIEVVEAALWERSGEALAFVQAGRMTALVPSGASPAAPRTETITLDDFAAGAGLARVDFLKLDVEGAEPRVLAGARRTLAASAPRLAIAAYHRDDDLVTLAAALDERFALYLAGASPVEEETVLFATARSSST